MIGRETRGRNKRFAILNSCQKRVKGDLFNGNERIFVILKEASLQVSIMKDLYYVFVIKISLTLICQILQKKCDVLHLDHL